MTCPITAIRPAAAPRPPCPPWPPACSSPPRCPRFPPRPSRHGFELDPEHTTVAFLVSHIGFAQTLGVFHEVDGGYTYDPETQELSDLEIVVRTASVDTFHDRRDEHVRSDDFLDVEAHPTMTFRMTDATPEGETTGTVTGDLTLLGRDALRSRLDVHPEQDRPLSLRQPAELRNRQSRPAARWTVVPGA